MRYTTINDLKDAHILLIGLGLLGGGVATANWLMRQGVRLTIFDAKNADQLYQSLQYLEGEPLLRLGENPGIEDVISCDAIVLNPGVSIYHHIVQEALKLSKPILNEATLFYHFWHKPKIAVTGTRGKTTTTAWTTYLLSRHVRAIATGNSPTHPLLKILDEQFNYDVAVTELSSFLLELFDETVPTTDIAILTNIYQDHLDRYQSFDDYAFTKTKIFRYQRPDQHVILNFDNQYTSRILQDPPASKIWLCSLSPLPADKDGIFYHQGQLHFQHDSAVSIVGDVADFLKEWGEHNVRNLMASAMAAYLHGVSWVEIRSSLSSMPQVYFRQETIYQDNNIRIINDTTATSPEGGIAALERFSGPDCILITGGTDKELDYTMWAEVVQKRTLAENIIMLSGSATRKMRNALGEFAESIIEYETLAECVASAMDKAATHTHATIVFSPAAKSFEKFKNEFDRGEQFTALVKEYLQKPRYE